MSILRTHVKWCFDLSQYFFDLKCCNIFSLLYCVCCVVLTVLYHWPSRRLFPPWCEGNPQIEDVNETWQRGSNIHPLDVLHVCVCLRMSDWIEGREREKQRQRVFSTLNFRFWPCWKKLQWYLISVTICFRCWPCKSLYFSLCEDTHWHNAIASPLP